MPNMETNDWIESYVNEIIKRAKQDGFDYNEGYIREQCAKQYKQYGITVKNDDGSYTTNYSYHIYLTK